MLAVCAVFLAGVLCGCGPTTVTVRDAQGNVTSVITISPQTPGTPTAPTAPAPTTPQGGAGEATAPPPTSSPDSTPPPAGAQNATASTVEDPGQGAYSTATRQALSELREKYNIRVSGQFDERAVQNVLWAARQYRPEDVGNLSIYYNGERRNRGVMGVYSPSGNINIYDPVRLHTVFHEMTHHVTLYRTHTRPKEIANKVARMVPPQDGTLQQAHPAYIPRSYARTNIAEFWAEFFTYFREKETGVNGGYPCYRGFLNPQVHPDQADTIAAIKKEARKLFVDGTQ